MPFYPKQAGASCIRRARRFLALVDEDLPDSKVKNDLRRMALVMSVAAIDSYMHGIVLRRLSQVRWQSDLPKALAKLDVSFAEISKLADTVIDAQRRGRHIRPWVRVKVALQNRILRETFQSYEQVAGAFSLAGIKKPWASIAAEMDESSDSIKRRLNSLVHRRNQIVHEGDLKRASRPQKIRFNGVERHEVVDYVDWVEKLLAAMDKVVSSHA